MRVCADIAVVFVFDGDGAHRALHVLTHPFPTRRSSDLPVQHRRDAGRAQVGMEERVAVGDRLGRIVLGVGGQRDHRSEEHTSELQSLMRISYAVFCLKKKTLLGLCILASIIFTTTTRSTTRTTTDLPYTTQ